MKETIETRELFLLSSGGGIPGTYHRPREGVFGITPPECLPGVVFLNSLSPTRAANGDLAVYLADAFACRGYPSFRIDLPGFGDADGAVPDRLHDYINRGDYAEVAAKAIRELSHRYHLSGVIVTGHCAGALTALFAAERSPECRGAILTSPYFYLPPTAFRPKIRQRLSVLSLKSPIFRLIRVAYDGLRQMRLLLHRLSDSWLAHFVARRWQNAGRASRRLLRGDLPENANRDFLRSWKQVASSGTPILLVMEPAHDNSIVEGENGGFDYLQHAMALAGPKGRVTVRAAIGADHSFANCAGRVAVRDLIESWLDATYARTTPGIDKVPVKAAPPETCEAESIAGASIQQV